MDGDEMVECVVTGAKGIYYGKMIPNPDPKKRPIDLHRLYEFGEAVNIARSDFMDFDLLNKGRNMSKGHALECSYREDPGHRIATQYEVLVKAGKVQEAIDLVELYRPVKPVSSNPVKAR